MIKPKAFIFPLFLVTFFILGFQYPQTLKGTWSLVKFYDAGKNQTIQKPKGVQSIAPHIVFDSVSHSGKAHGVTGCNKFTVTFVQDSSQIKFSWLEITEVAEVGWSKTFIMSMFSPADYHFKSDTLVFTHSDGNQLFWVSKPEE